MSKPKTNYYLTEYTDETVPCDCTLQGWADWLNAPSEDWNRDSGALNDEEFDAFTIEVLGDVRAEWQNGKWEAVEAIPEGTASFFLRHCQGGDGWDAEFAADTIEDASDCIHAEDGPLWFACTRNGPSIRVRFNRTADGPRLTILATVQ